MTKTRYFVENVTNQETRHLVGDDHGYGNRIDAIKARDNLAVRFPEEIYTIYTRGDRR